MIATNDKTLRVGKKSNNPRNGSLLKPNERVQDNNRHYLALNLTFLDALYHEYQKSVM